MKTLLPLLISACLGLGAATTAHAVDNPWIVHVGVHVGEPKSNNGQVAGMRVDVDNATRPTASIEYLFTPNWSVDLLASAPFKHDIRLDGQKLATTKQLPPTLGVNYHFIPDARISPFVGAGLNYTRFFETRATGALRGNALKIDNSWGVAAHAGVDIKLAPNWLFTVDARWMRIRGDVHLNGSNVGRANIDPMVYGVSFGYRF